MVTIWDEWVLWTTRQDLKTSREVLPLAGANITLCESSNLDLSCRSALKTFVIRFEFSFRNHKLVLTKRERISQNLTTFASSLNNNLSERRSSSSKKLSSSITSNILNSTSVGEFRDCYAIHSPNDPQTRGLDDSTIELWWALVRWRLYELNRRFFHCFLRFAFSYLKSPTVFLFSLRLLTLH